MPVKDSANSGLERALKRFSAALDSLEIAIDGQLEGRRSTQEAENEVQRVNADRVSLAEELDKSAARGTRLEGVNKEVSHRLVTAMETIRGVIDKQTGDKQSAETAE